MVVYHMYEATYEIGKASSASLPAGCLLVKNTPSFNKLIKRQIRFRDYIWKIISFDKCTIYEVLDRNKQVIHRSLHIGKNFKFKFLHQKNEFEIGPCFTVEHARGQGIYPYVLTVILKDYPNANHFMLIADSNSSSIHGVKSRIYENRSY